MSRHEFGWSMPPRTRACLDPLLARQKDVFFRIKSAVRAMRFGSTLRAWAEDLCPRTAAHCNHSAYSRLSSPMGQPRRPPSLACGARGSTAGCRGVFGGLPHRAGVRSRGSNDSRGGTKGSIGPGRAHARIAPRLTQDRFPVFDRVSTRSDSAAVAELGRGHRTSVAGHARLRPPAVSAP